MAWRDAYDYEKIVSERVFQSCYDAIKRLSERGFNTEDIYMALNKAIDSAIYEWEIDEGLWGLN